jgi:hypothetical protein
MFHARIQRQIAEAGVLKHRVELLGIINPERIQVLAQRSRKQIWTLWDKRELVSKRRASRARDINAVKAKATVAQDGKVEKRLRRSPVCMGGSGESG